MLKSVSKKENHLDGQKPKWFAVYTRYKREKIVSKELSRLGIENYLPLQKFYRSYERKKKIVELPLFSCYLFVKITKQEFRKVEDLDGVVKFVNFSNNLISIPEEEVLIIKRIVGEGTELEVEEQKFEEGDYVEVIRGSLNGLKGKLLHKKSKKNFLIELDKVGYNIKLEINPKDVVRTSKSIVQFA